MLGNLGCFQKLPLFEAHGWLLRGWLYWRDLLFLREAEREHLRAGMCAGPARAPSGAGSSIGEGVVALL